VRGAGIECDKQRRQGCTMTKAKQPVLCAARREPIDFRCPQHPSRLGFFAMDAQKPRQWRRPVLQSEKTFS
jgi:hypothetical protein